MSQPTYRVELTLAEGKHLLSLIPDEVIASNMHNLYLRNKFNKIMERLIELGEYEASLEGGFEREYYKVGDIL